MTTAAAKDRLDAFSRPLTLELAARLDEALRARPLEDLPSGYARPVYDLLRAHGLDRADLLAIAASLVDLVVSDVAADPA